MHVFPPPLLPFNNGGCVPCSMHHFQFYLSTLLIIYLLPLSPSLTHTPTHTQHTQTEESRKREGTGINSWPAVIHVQDGSIGEGDIKLKPLNRPPFLLSGLTNGTPSLAVAAAAAASSSRFFIYIIHSFTSFSLFFFFPFVLL